MKLDLVGFSAGAYTGPVAIGGTPNPVKAVAHCAQNRDELVCQVGMTIPVQLWAASEDRNAPNGSNSENMRQAIEER